MPRLKEYERLRQRAPEMYPARFHEALLKLMAGATRALIGMPKYGDLESQRREWCLFVQSFDTTTPMGQFIMGNLLRTAKTNEPGEGLVMWATSRPRFTREISDALK